MVYGIIQLINFAHGEIFMVGAFAGLTMFKYVLPDSIQENAYLAMPLVLLAAVVVAVIAAILMERLAYRPLRHAPRLAPLITAIGVSLFLQDVAMMVWGRNYLYLPQIVNPTSYNIGEASITDLQMLIMVRSEERRVGKECRSRGESSQ